jgi:filamentous hemagglutinin
MMRGNGGVDHWVVVDGLDDLGRVMVRDPFQGSSYRMLQNEFHAFWNGIAIWGNKP